MLGWILAGLLGTAAVAAIVITINGIINKRRIEEEMRKRDVEKVIVKKVDECDNVLTLKDLDSDAVYEINGDDIADDIYEGQYITI